ncbi:MAG: YbjN domain-containing protein [Gemmatimonadota bacterium]|nr:YbjN domain-containing protein [Gemmatimonadota bacterium]
MVTKEDIESFLDRLSSEGVDHEEIGEGMWVIRPEGALDADLVCSYAPPVVVMRVKVMDLPDDPAAAASLARRLLELNATDLVHGSYGIEDQSVVLTEALELSHLDFEEFLASYEGMTVALASHLRELAPYREAR